LPVGFNIPVGVYPITSLASQSKRPFKYFNSSLPRGLLFWRCGGKHAGCRMTEDQQDCRAGEEREVLVLFFVLAIGVSLKTLKAS